MDEYELAKLLERYKQGNCTEDERLLIESLHLHAYPDEPAAEDPAAKRRVWQLLRKELPSGNIGTQRIQWFAATASLLLIATIASLYRSESKNTPVPQLVDIAAGGNKAMLKLADGQTVNLDSSQHGVMILSDRLLYRDSTLAGNIHDDYETREDVYNEIVTPRGGTYQVVLADGTRVWLNADSRLKFPQRFGQKREVTLVGEAYFEVTKSQNRPFVVKTVGQEIVVLGTSFNVAAYADEPSEQTTLVEGEIVVATAQSTRQLTPGDQAVVRGNGIAVGQVDTSPFVAWKSGFIAFNEETLERIMRDISRWYDVDIHFEEVDNQLRFGGTVSRYANVSEVLRRLELTGQVHFKIEERGIVVTP
ncbi:FecR family protein [Parapedobacter tibetensis]|uniref:FecR family protein n=1 Tax=Parapedobacter tibetensis TaxID=2972951 RepID=UPI00214D72D8|nr:FecR family protein [Parapedobacter tibetensis]